MVVMILMLSNESFSVVLAISWHPIHESLFVSGGSDGSMMFWMVG